MTELIFAADGRSNVPPQTFANRHIGPDTENIRDMLSKLGLVSLDELIRSTLPAGIRDESALGFGHGLSEEETLAIMHKLSERNIQMISMIGQGYYHCHLPPVIQRNLLENPAWYTAYTPYQPEISQGRLEAILNFQTLVSDLTGLSVANASLLDEATAAAEAMALARRASKSKNTSFFVDKNCHPQTIAVLRTRAEPLDWNLVVGDPDSDLNPDAVFGACFQYPGTNGEVRDFTQHIKGVQATGGVVAMAADPLALTLLTPPGELGADIAIGSMQRFGVPMGYGGPHAGYMAVREGLQRMLPGRLVGVSIDAAGRRAYRLALQTREQHIRREKATSNICTAQVLLAIIASMYAVYHGPEGLSAIARRTHNLAARFAKALGDHGVQVENGHFFDTITVRITDAKSVMARALAAGINLREIGPERVSISFDETSTIETLKRLAPAFHLSPDVIDGQGAGTEYLPTALKRVSDFLQHPAFHRYRSETEMMRYLRRLSDRDLALDRTMIPLGSCTMKLNAAAEMMPISWGGFAHIHPFAPIDQAEGYQAMLADLAERLCKISGYAAVSLQPNSGAQGEYAGLLAIRRYHLSRGDAHRKICLIPSSAHGTNPASAQMVGMSVVVVACDDAGNVDLDDLEVKIARHANELAAIMITYPSTHGVFEEAVREICQKVHAAGGQVYLDGANLNAQVGLARPGDYGADVSHFNLHKTFCIPHGGGGPGMGPIGVGAHLAPFLPGDPREESGGAVSAAPFGSASILPISYAYLLLMGDEGLKAASQVAILNANYIAHALEPYYTVLYRGREGFIAHECILDVRQIKAETGVSVDDIAKRLIDFGFHAPTMSFPVPGTLMVEPTESESLAELDRFCGAMIAIAKEIEDIRAGTVPVEQSALRLSPHTMEDIMSENWDRPYSRQQGGCPAGQSDKYWPPVKRVDNSYGDKNLVCSCPPIEDYMAAAE